MARQGFPTFDQILKLSGLLRNPVSRSVFVCAAGKRRRLFGQLPEIVTDEGNPIVKLIG
jgi:hypothetical protein